MRVIVPAAGHGQRFRAAGYAAPKPAITVRGRSLLAWAFDPIPDDWDIVLVCQASDVSPVIHAVSRAVHLLAIPYPTQGAACTVLAAAVGVPPDEPVAVMNCDQTFVCDLADVQRRAEREAWDGYILTFPATEDRWSYAAVSPGTGWVTRVAEKEAISPDATVGFYWFRRASDLVWACAQTIALAERIRGEFYLAPVFNHLIQRGARVAAVPVEHFVGLGTPEDVRIFATEAA